MELKQKLTSCETPGEYTAEMKLLINFYLW